MTKMAVVCDRRQALISAALSAATGVALFGGATPGTCVAEDDPPADCEGQGDDKAPIALGPAVVDAGGIRVHTVTSPYQAGATRLRVLPPNQLHTGRKYPAVYVLPVEPGDGARYGDGLKEVQQRDLHNRQSAIFVAPEFSAWPWYGDHPTRPEVRQESHFLKAVIPLVEQAYPVSSRSQDRLLLGFSKSGWGAWTLLLRHPDRFARAAAWDAPLMMQEPGLYGTSDVFPTLDEFAKYRPADLLRDGADELRKRPRLILSGYGNFRRHHQEMHALLDELRIRHAYLDGPARAHDWHSGWVEAATELLFADEAALGRREE